MHRILLTIIIVLSAMGISQAQKLSISGSIYDTAHQRYLGFATVSLMQAKDSALVSFTRADSVGQFSLGHPGKGKYVVAISYVGYLPLWKTINLKEQESYKMGKIILTDIKSLNDVTISAKRAPVMINNDTLEFNTENFATQPNAVVEDLLKKLPGVTVDGDGGIKVNGQSVNKVYVNGKEFFSGDPKMATKNLNADAVDKVQVFDKKTDQATFTGVDDGNSEKAINIKLKKDRDNAVFGKVTAGANGDDRFDGQTNMNRFKGDKQLSFIAMGNNTNKQGFSMMDVMNFTGEMGKMMKGAGGINIKTFTDGPENAGLPVMGNSQNGIAQTFAGGLNYNDNWKKKTDFNGSGTVSDIRLNNESVTGTQYIDPIMNKNYVSTSYSIQKQQRANFTIDHAIDSFTSVKFVPSITWQQQQQSSFGNYTTQSFSKIKLNDGVDTSHTNSDAVQSTNTVLLRHKFKKKSRTFSLSANFNYNMSNQHGDQYSRNTIDTFSVAMDSIINQQNSKNATTSTYGANATYTEPISKNSLLEFNTFYNRSEGEVNKSTYDFDKNSKLYTIRDSILSNNFRSEYTYTGGGLNYRKSKTKYNYNFGFSLQSATLNSTNKTNNNTLHQSFTDILPNFSYQYKFNMFSNLRLEYNTAVQQPTTSQLQPVLNLNGLLNISTGNPNLTRAYSHNVNFNYFGGDFFKQRMFFGFVNASYTNDAIVNSDSTYMNGSRKTMPVNANGQWNVFANGGYGFYIKKIKSRIFVNLGATLNHNIGFINGSENKIDNRVVNPNLMWNFSIDKVIDIQASATLMLSRVEYSLQPMLNSNYNTQKYGLDIIKDLPWSMTLTNKFTYSINSGLSSGYNSSVPLWNASLAKSFMKNKRAEVKLSVADLLNQNTGISRNASQNYIEDVRYTVLQRYFLLSFTYSLNKSGKMGGGPPMPHGMSIRVDN